MMRKMVVHLIAGPTSAHLIVSRSKLSRIQKTGQVPCVRLLNAVRPEPLGYQPLARDCSSSLQTSLEIPKSYKWGTNLAGRYLYLQSANRGWKKGYSYDYFRLFPKLN
jgi:hypothetical protein